MLFNWRLQEQASQSEHKFCQRECITDTGKLSILLAEQLAALLLSQGISPITCHCPETWQDLQWQEVTRNNSVLTKKMLREWRKRPTGLFYIAATFLNESPWGAMFPLNPSLCNGRRKASGKTYQLQQFSHFLAVKIFDFPSNCSLVLANYKWNVNMLASSLSVKPEKKYFFESTGLSAFSQAPAVVFY